MAAFGPSIAGFVMAAATGGWAGVRHLLARLVPTWANRPWYAGVLLGFPAASFASAWFLDRDSLSRLASWDRLICLVPITLVFDTGPLGEEFGWRGFALPRLLKRWPPLAAALILGAIWWAWHLPTFFIRALSQSRLSISLYVVNILALSILMTGLYLRTGGDLLLMILVHVMANWCPVPFRSEVCAEVALAALTLGSGWLWPRVQRGFDPAAERLQDLLSVMKHSDSEHNEAIQRFVRLVLFQAQQDKARELVIGIASAGGVPVKYTVKDTWHEMPPFPCDIRADVVSELVRMAGFHSGQIPGEGTLDESFSGTRLRWVVAMTSPDGECTLKRVDD